MVSSAEIALAPGQEFGFHFLVLAFTPRMFHHHVSAATIGGVSLEG